MEEIMFGFSQSKTYNFRYYKQKISMFYEVSEKNVVHMV